MKTSTLNRTLVRALVTGLRATADSLEEGLQQAATGLEDFGGAEAAEDDGKAAARTVPATGPSWFDPLTDEPPKKPDPVGSPEAKSMSWMTYIGAVYAINRREDRGATPAEVRKYAMKAGYPDGRAVSGFSNRGGATETREGTRWVNEAGADWLKELQKELDIELPEDLRAV
jgi:hypothetical protein